MPELRDLPAVDSLLQAPELTNLLNQYGLQTVKNAIRELQQNMRKNKSVPDWAVTPIGYDQAIKDQLGKVGYTPIFNLTGTIIHTNLGRALLSRELWRDIEPLVTRPMNLEYDITAGRRGDRDAIVEQRICSLTGCEAATIVNNNAAALMIVLNTFALNKEVPVSRGELVEIGGSFRLPELMSRSGCTLLEIGTTNRTRSSDFEEVLDRAAMLLKIHPSNFYIQGFTESVGPADLARMSKASGLPSCIDLGSGSLVDLTHWGLPAEPTPQQVLAEGIDLVTFSGDKLLGGVQSGIIAGKRELIEQIRKNPMKRAMRADKITLAVLEATLKLYENPESLHKHLPLLRTLQLTQHELTARAEQVSASLPDTYQSTVVASEVQIGSGALPDQTIESLAVQITHPSISPDSVAKAMRDLDVPVVGRIRDDSVLLDMRGADHIDELCAQLGKLTS